MTSRFAIAKQKILDDLENVIAAVMGANAHRRHMKGGGWNVTNPYRAQAKPDQMYIWLRGGRRGAWKDFVSGEKGDAIDLVAYCLEGIVHADSRMRAVEWVEDRYGIRQMDPAQKKKLADQAQASKERMERQDADRRHGNRERSRKMFFAADARILGTPVETYLAGRGVQLVDVPNLSPAFRFQPDCEYWLGAPRDGEGNRLGRGPRFPALVSAMVSADGTLNACHLTFIAHDGRGKAPVEKAKLMWPETSGFVVRCTNGPSAMRPEDAAQAGIAGVVGLTEGIEDALSAAIAEPGLRMWAAGSLSGLLHVPDHACASGWLVFQDNDWGKPQAKKLFDRAVARLRATGKPVEVIAMPADWGKDVNDAINHGESDAT